ncbi:Transmembrane emp24 domain-containing protein p24delta9 [Heracleum sosnowskyi]|uniref:Transmembrane emp24 domain-containing protein p24delta9 n=1 Tax=Heracleum sosnowskyi TaxID=360622 RepID=A0AAD8I5N1_9APIA|nr:Transmembrane emp24 domain-containing protein p24delta9 [Heracleum sosnowskyi]
MVYRSCMVVFIILGTYITVSESLRFDLESGHSKCISEDIRVNSMTLGKYSIINPIDNHPLPDSHKLIVRVSSEHGRTYHSADNVDSGQFSFQAVEAGDYVACFLAVDHKPATALTVDFEWKSGIAAKDWTNVAKKGSIDAMELEVKKLLETVTSVHEEMFYLREREQEMQKLNTAINSSMSWLSLLSLLICFSVSGLHLWHLKSFFEKKKII